MSNVKKRKKHDWYREVRNSIDDCLVNSGRIRFAALMVFVISMLFLQTRVAAENYSPVVEIISPVDGSKFKVGEKIIFKGSAVDLEDGELPSKNFIWTSDLNGYINQGNSFRCLLSTGSHIIILTVSDSEFSMGKDSVFITIEDFSKKTKIAESVEKIKKIDIKELEKSGEEIEVKKPVKPSLEFIFVPPFGSFKDLKGRALNVDPNNFVIAVYIVVDGVWWTKPYWEKPITKINNDGTWVCDITTDGFDETAIKIAAYLIPISYKPLLASGDFRLLQELEKNSLAKIEVVREISDEILRESRVELEDPAVKKPEIKKEIQKETIIVRKSVDISKKINKLQARLAKTEEQEQTLRTLLSQLDEQEEKLKKQEKWIKAERQRLREIKEKKLLGSSIIERIEKILAQLSQFKENVKQIKESVERDKQLVLVTMEKLLEIRKKILQQQLRALEKERE